MHESLLDLLILDHRRIRSMYRELRTGCDDVKVNEGACFNLFRSFKVLVQSYAKAEELTLYELLEETKDPALADLRHFALEGNEKHDLAEFLLKEMGQAEEVTPRWLAQLTVLIDLLERHLNQEEGEFFPRIAALVDPEKLSELGATYIKERDHIAARKSGTMPSADRMIFAPH